MHQKPIYQCFKCYQPMVARGNRGGNIFFSPCLVTAEATTCYRCEVTAKALSLGGLNDLLPMLPQTCTYSFPVFLEESDTTRYHKKHQYGGYNHERSLFQNQEHRRQVKTAAEARIPGGAESRGSRAEAARMAESPSRVTDANHSYNQNVYKTGKFRDGGGKLIWTKNV